MSQLTLKERIQFKYFEQLNRRQIKRIAEQVAKNEPDQSGIKPVVIFNASTRIISLSQSAAFSQITAWGLRMAGIPVKHFVCDEGMSRCVLGTDENKPKAALPCDLCTANSKRIYAGASTSWFKHDEDKELDDKLGGLSTARLENFFYKNIPLGQIALPSLRWRLRRHQLLDDSSTRYLYREFIKSAWNVAQKFSRFLDETDPRMVIVFNGQSFPESAAKFVAKNHGIPVVTYEVGVMPLTAFFTTGEATAYPIIIPEEFELNADQNKRLDDYLDQRLKGQFSMAGISFWPEMQELSEDLLKKIGDHKQMVPIFTNVIFDTSQHHANVAFEHMFEWLDMVNEVVEQNRDTLFILRAHPDEDRPGKASQESVGMWVEKIGFDKHPNVLFIPSSEYVSSYALVQRAKFVMIYNSSIGLESTLMGKPVLSAGKARFSAYPTVYFPQSARNYRQMLDEFLSAETVELPDEFVRNGRRFLYFQLYKTSLPFGEFVSPHKLRGYVYLKKFSLDQLSIESSPALKVICESILSDPTFLLDN